MISYIWPMSLVIIANIVYQICAKSVSPNINPLASATITYLVGAAFSTVIYYALNKNGNLFKEFRQMNWASVVLGFVIVGLEVGFIYVYKAGWPVSTASIVQSAFLAVVLTVVGLLLYNEAITWNKVLGIAICIVGLYFINR